MTFLIIRSLRYKNLQQLQTLKLEISYSLKYTNKYNCQKAMMILIDTLGFLSLCNMIKVPPCQHQSLSSHKQNQPSECQHQAIHCKKNTLDEQINEGGSNPLLIQQLQQYYLSQEQRQHQVRVQKRESESYLFNIPSSLNSIQLFISRFYKMYHETLRTTTEQGYEFWLTSPPQNRQQSIILINKTSDEHAGPTDLEFSLQTFSKQMTVKIKDVSSLIMESNKTKNINFLKFLNQHSQMITQTYSLELIDIADKITEITQENPLIEVVCEEFISILEKITLKLYPQNFDVISRRLERLKISPKLVEQMRSNLVQSDDKQIQALLNLLCFKLNHHQNKNDYLGEIKGEYKLQQCPISLECSGCLPYLKRKSNLYDPIVTRNKIFIAHKAKDFLNLNSPQSISKVKQIICASINETGSVILFDCQDNSHSILPKGVKISTLEREYILKKLKEVVQSLRPRLFTGQVSYQFVPVVGQDDGSDEMEIFEEQQMEVVLRIVVRPGNPNIQYSFCDQNYYFSSSLKQSGSNVNSQLKVKQILESRVVVKSQIELDEYEALMAYYSNSSNSCFDHQNCQPLLTGKELLLLTNRQKAVKILEEIYKFASVVVIKKQHLQIFREKLANLFCDFDLVMPFLSVNIKGSTATAILYHNKPFVEVLSFVTYNTEFQFDGKPVIMLAIPEMVKLCERNQFKKFKRADFDALQTWASYVFKGEKIALSLWNYINDRNETQVYLKASGHRACTFLMYLVLNNSNERSVLKIPKNTVYFQRLFVSNLD